MGDLVEIAGRKQNWSPEEAFSVASRQPCKRVLIITVDKEGDINAYGSDMTLEQMLFMLETAKHKYVFG